MKIPQPSFAAPQGAPRLPLLLRWPWLLTLLVGLALGLLAPQRSQAQAPANDLCTSAAPLTAASTCTPIAGTLDGATADAALDVYYDVWYSFTATGTENHVVVGGTAAGNLVTIVYGTCPNSSTPTVSYNSSSTDHYLTGLTPGQPYKVRVYDIYNTVHSGGSGNFTICLTKPFTPTPANNLCTAPQLITKSTPCVNTTGTVGGATADPALDEFDDVWYSFVANGTQHTIVVTPTGGASLFTDVYTVACPTSSTVAISHSGSTTLLTGLTPGTTYTVRVSNAYSSAGFLSPADGAFTICVDNANPPPANDECAGAIGLGTINSTCTSTSGTLFGATQSGVSGGSGTADDDVWYSFVATNARAGVYLTNTGGLDLVVDLRGGACASTSSIRYGNQAGSTAGTVDSVSVHNLVVGTTYFVRVYSFGTTSSTAGNGTFMLCVTTPGVCAPPTLLNATNITNTGAQLNWTAGAAGVQYKVEYGASGFAPGTGTVLTTALTSVTITGLTSATAYQFYVTQTCASTVSSVRVGPQAFSTTGLTTLNVNTTQTITGAYDIVHVLPTGHATLGADFTVNVSMDVQDGGSLNTSCHVVTGTGTFTLAAGARLYICASGGIHPNGNNGDIQVMGTRSFSSDASYTYNRANSGQSTGDGLPGTVRELEVNGTGNLLTTTNSVSISRTLKITNGDINPNGQTLTLLSGPTGTALIDNTGGIVQGPIHAQRYVQNTLNSGLGYRHFSAPVQGATVSQLATSGSPIITNPAYNSATAAVKPTITPYPTVFSYDQSQVNLGGTAAFDKGWQSPASNAAPLTPMQGYTTQVSGGQTVTFSGMPNNAGQSMSGLSNSGGLQSGWHLLGNPYPSPIDWSTMTTGFSPTDNLLDMSGAVYVFQTTGHYAGTYRSYQNGFGGNSVIASGQGFFVRNVGLGTPGVVRLFNNNRVTTWTATNSTLYRGNDPRTHLVLALASPNAPADEATVYFENGATAVLDARFDASKLRNPGAASIFSLAGPEELDINGLPLLTNAQVVVPLGYAVAAPGPCTFNVAALANLPATTGVWLRDAQTGTLTDLRRQPAYAFVAAAGNLSNSSRFALVFGPAGVLAAASQFNAAQVALFPNPARREVTLQLPALPTAKAVKVQLFNALGQSVLVRELPLTATGLTARFDLSAVPVGVYSLRLTAAGTAPVTKRLTIE